MIRIIVFFNGKHQGGSRVRNLRPDGDHVVWCDKLPLARMMFWRS